MIHVEDRVERATAPNETVTKLLLQIVQTSAFRQTALLTAQESVFIQFVDFSFNSMTAVTDITVILFYRAALST